jgi:hypothetical protein
VICIVAAVVAVVSYIGSGALYRGIGKGTFYLDSDEARPAPKPQTAASRAEAEAEIRQMVEAKSHRRVARGQAPLDVEAEIAELTKPAETVHDAALRDEVRQLVIARNERRARQGKQPLDVETEIDRQLRDLGA